MLNKQSFFYSTVRIALFILLPLAASLFMFFRMSDAIREYIEDEAAKEAAFQSSLISRQINETFTYMQIISEYFSESRVPEEHMEMTLSNLVSPAQMKDTGILRFDESAVVGEPLRFADYPSVGKSFRGSASMMYSEGRGFLLTVPIYNNGNIKYVLYEFFDKRELFASSVVDGYDGQAQLCIADSQSQTAVAFYGDDDASFYFDPHIQNVFKELDRKMGLGISAAVYNVHEGERELWFVSLIGHPNMFLVGRVPYDAVAGGIEPIFIMVIVVTVLMLVLLAIGTMSIVSAGEKIRESEELRKAKQLAEEANKSKGAFIANMSHELRTPINVILGMNEMILREEASDLTKERALDIKSAAQILLSLINDVLDYSKIESGKMNIICTEYSLVSMIRDLTLLTENRARQKSLEFSLEIDPELPTGLYGDDIRIRQILTNLLTNAVKYTPEGKVTLKINGAKNGENITLHCEVSDTGMGIKPEDIEKLTVPFMRVDEERNRTVEGTGLGMPIIVNLLDLMGSRLNISSVYGEGSTFWFDIDQKIVDSEPVGDIYKRMGDVVKEYSYTVSFTAPKARILMVDDNSMNRQIFESLLKKTKIDITTVSSGQKCLELVQSEHFDIIFMDYLMPEMNGIETLRELKKMENNLCKDTPVIVLTANAFSGDREKYMSYGFDDFLAKPIVTEKLEAMIVDFLPDEYVSTEKTEAAPEEELPEIDGLNSRIAKLYLKENALILGAIKTYYGRLKTDLAELPPLYDNIGAENGLSDYRIRVHALKGTSAMVGAMTISELAKLLEFAARDGDTDRIRAVHPILLTEMEKLLPKLSQFAPEEEAKPVSDDLSALKAQLTELRSLMEQMNFDGAAAAMEHISESAYGGEVGELVKRLDEDVSVMCYDEANEKIDKILSIIEG